MKQDLDRLMDERDLSAVMISGSSLGNPAMAYLVNGAGISGGYVVKKVGQEPVLFCSPIEREVAASSGLEVVNLSRYNPAQILRDSTDELSASVELHRRIFADMDVSGTVGFYGSADQGRAWLLLGALSERLDGIDVSAEFGPNVLDLARATKDLHEVNRIKDVGWQNIFALQIVAVLTMWETTLFRKRLPLIIVLRNTMFCEPSLGMWERKSTRSLRTQLVLVQHRLCGAPPPHKPFRWTARRISNGANPDHR